MDNGAGLVAMTEANTEATRAMCQVNGSIEIYPEAEIIQLVMTGKDGSRIEVPFTLDGAMNLVEALGAAVIYLKEQQGRRPHGKERIND